MATVGMRVLVMREGSAGAQEEYIEVSPSFAGIDHNLSVQAVAGKITLKTYPSLVRLENHGLLGFCLLSTMSRFKHVAAFAVVGGAA